MNEETIELIKGISRALFGIFLAFVVISFLKEEFSFMKFFAPFCVGFFGYLGWME